MAFWCGEDGFVQAFNEMYHNSIPGKILFFLKHSIFVNGRLFDHVLAHMNWYLPLNDPCVNVYEKPVSDFCNHLFERPNESLFMPVQRIFCKFVYAETSINFQDVLVVIPRLRHLNI